ncbi:MAG: hypothetical protein SGJ27_20605 [Candidatus Melainabacteria bacterium]|nr:hypothetical protein [Candidatus Melainabacteria bacterium]
MTNDRTVTASTKMNSTANGVSGTTISVGVPGNIRTLNLEGSDWTAGDVLKYAELEHSGYEIRINGSPARLDSLIRNSDNLLLFRKLVGN